LPQRLLIDVEIKRKVDVVAAEAWAYGTPRRETLLSAKALCAIWFRFLPAFTDLEMASHNRLQMFSPEGGPTSFKLFSIYQLPK